MSDVLPFVAPNKLVERLVAFYGPPNKVANVASYLKEFASQTAEWTTEELDLAATKVIGGRKFSTWPSILECTQACNAARQALAAKRYAQARQERQAQRLPIYEREPTALEFAEGRKLIMDITDGRYPMVELGVCAAVLRKLAWTMRRRMEARS